MRLPAYFPAAVVPCLLLALACGGSDGPTNPGNGDDPPAATGSIQASVTADGAARSGVSVSVLDVGASQPRATATTAATGITVFSGLPVASYDVRVSVPTGLALPSGQSETRRVAVTEGNQTQVSFALVSGGGGGGEQIINIQGLSFSPADVTVARGTTVQWVNPDNVFHTVTPQGHSEWTSASLPSAGSTFSHTFNTAGEFAYFCQPHQGQGMTGIIRVQ